MSAPKFFVTIDAPDIGQIRLPVARTALQIADLRTRYTIIEVSPASVSTHPPKSSAWSDAVGALVRLRQSAMGKGDQELANRAEKAIGELYGVQKFVEAENSDGSERSDFGGEPISDVSTRHTMIGLGRGR